MTGEGHDLGGDVRLGAEGAGAEADYGGDLAKGAGVDLNGGENLKTYSKDYSYSDHLESGEASDPSTVEQGVDLNDYNSGYTNEDIRNSLGHPMDLNTGAETKGAGAAERPRDDHSEGGYSYSKEAGSERLDSIMGKFQEDAWSDLTLDEQKQAMSELATFVASDTKNPDPPEIVFRDDMGEGEYGGYNPGTNTLVVNENMLDDAAEAADTIAHEMWHAHQHQCASDPASEKGREYQEGFDNYISPDYDYEGYQNQMVEAEARQYAQGFKNMVAGTQGA